MVSFNQQVHEDWIGICMQGTEAFVASLQQQHCGGFPFGSIPGTMVDESQPILSYCKDLTPKGF